MANSYTPLSSVLDPWVGSPRTCGPMGLADAGSPFSRLLGDTSGALGVSDWASPGAGKYWRALETSSPRPKGPEADPNFTVPEGQVTFNAEGNDSEKSQFFSRRLHHPSPGSGVTLGRGYDMKFRDQPEIKKHLIAAGVSEADAATYAEGAGLDKKEADEFVKKYRTTLGPITAEQQKELFVLVYPGYRREAKRLCAKWVKGMEESTAWDDLNQAVRDVLVDRRYQGAATKARFRAAADNYAKELITIIESELRQYEPGRGRIPYLRRHGSG